MLSRPKSRTVLSGKRTSQIVLPFLGPPLTLTTLPRRYAAGGLTEYRGIPLHVSRGVGMERGSAPQVRFLCPPEICLLTIRY